MPLPSVDMPMPPLDFDIAVFAANEARTIVPCLESVDLACSGMQAHISVLLNGTCDETLELIRAMHLQHAGLTVYFIEKADKANAINQYIHRVRPPAQLYICVDAYTRITPDSFKAMKSALDSNPQADIASGLPVSGRSAVVVAENTMKGGMVNGQLYAVRPDFLARVVGAGYRLPLQLYRVDGLLGSMAAHALDPVRLAWDSSRIIGVKDASFALTPLSIFKLRDIRRQYVREIRQARGRMENAAIKEIIFKDGYAGLPENANDMIKQWLRDHKPVSRSPREQYFTRLALKQLRKTDNLSASEPSVVLEIG